MNEKVVIYARVSTRVQEYERQLVELRTYAAKMGYIVVREFAENVSGAKKVSERAALSEMMQYVEKNHVDKVLVYECSRLSRRAVDFLQVVEALTSLRISVYVHQNGLETLLPTGDVNPISQLAMGILAQFNSLERTLIRDRMESGYNHFRANGGKVGRKKGYRKSIEEYKIQYGKEISLLKKGVSQRNVSAITGTSLSTISFISRYVVNKEK